MASLDVRPVRKGPLRLDPVPEILRPLIRAYLLGYASAVAPRLLTLVLQHVAKRRRKAANQLPLDSDDTSFVKSATHIVKTGFNLQRFPTFCAVLVGGGTLLQVIGPFLMTFNAFTCEMGPSRAEEVVPCRFDSLEAYRLSSSSDTDR